MIIQKLNMERLGKRQIEKKEELEVIEEVEEKSEDSGDWFAPENDFWFQPLDTATGGFCAQLIVYTKEQEEIVEIPESVKESSEEISESASLSRASKDFFAPDEIKVGKEKDFFAPDDVSN